MEALQALIPVLLTLSLAGLVLAVGLNSSRQDLLYVVTRPKLLARAVLAVIAIPPVVAGVIIAFAPVEPVVKAGVMLMAISPVPPLVPGKQLAIGGRKSYAYGLYAAMALLTIISVPVTLFLASSMFGRNDYISVDTIAQTVLMGVVLPLAIGQGIRTFFSAFAAVAWKWVYRISLALVLVAFIPIAIKFWPAMLDLIGDGTLLLMAIITVINLAVGHALGGPNIRDRATLAVTAAVRHPGIAIAIAATSFKEPRVAAAIILFMLVGLVVAIPYQMWIKRHAPPAVQPSEHAHA